jgi:hypothetical protein
MPETEIFILFSPDIGTDHCSCFIFFCPIVTSCLCYFPGIAHLVPGRSFLCPGQDFVRISSHGLTREMILHDTAGKNTCFPLLKVVPEKMKIFLKNKKFTALLF